jgi:hypothetical protein
MTNTELITKIIESSYILYHTEDPGFFKISDYNKKIVREIFIKLKSIGFNFVSGGEEDGISDNYFDCRGDNTYFLYYDDEQEKFYREVANKFEPKKSAIITLEDLNFLLKFAENNDNIIHLIDYFNNIKNK